MSELAIRALKDANTILRALSLNHWQPDANFADKVNQDLMKAVAKRAAQNDASLRGPTVLTDVEIETTKTKKWGITSFPDYRSGLQFFRGYGKKQSCDVVEFWLKETGLKPECIIRLRYRLENGKQILAHYCDDFEREFGEDRMKSWF